MRNVRSNITGMITLWRRHSITCPHADKGRNFIKCNCPIWADGYNNGKREFRQSLDTRDMARARKKAADLEAEDNRTRKAVAEAVKAFLAHCTSDGLKYSTISKYRNTLNKLMTFCAVQEIDSVSELTIDALDDFRASRKLKAITSSKELQLLRQFYGYCKDRSWVESNVAQSVKPPRNIQPNNVEPFSPSEVVEIITAAGMIGHNSYERLRARAMILVFRYTALRLGDVAMLAHDRVSRDGSRWRIFLRTEKNGKPIFLPIPTEMKDALDLVPTPRGAIGESRHYFWNGVTKEKTLKKNFDDTLRSVFKRSGVPRAHAHRFRHTLATELLGRGATFEEIADILGNSPEIARKHYGKWSVARQGRIDDLMEKVHSQATYHGHIVGTSQKTPRKPLIQ